MTQQLQDLQDELQTDLISWSEMLREARSQHYYLTYLHPEQLYYLLDYMESPQPVPPVALKNTFMFINPQYGLDTVEAKHIDAFEDVQRTDLFGTLCFLGRLLHKVVFALISSRW